MGLNSSDWGNIVGGAVSAYSPQAGAAVSSIFSKPKAPPPPVQSTLVTPPPSSPTIPVYVWVVGGVMTVVLVIVLATRR